MKQTLLLSLGLALLFCGSTMAEATAAGPAEMISQFRSQHGEGRVTLDSRLNRIAQAQADAMAAKDVLEHDVLGSFNSRAAAAGAGRAAENIAYGYDSFAKTLDQWINSSGHRHNLLMPGASKVGVAHAQSSKTHRTYWAMEIAGDYERAPSRTNGRLIVAGTPTVVKHLAETHKPHAAEACRLKLLGLCL
jgi:hypothetical protein